MILSKGIKSLLDLGNQRHFYNLETGACKLKYWQLTVTSNDTFSTSGTVIDPGIPVILNYLKKRRRQKMASPKLTVLPLGAGNDVGRSCILVTINNKRILLDCGIHAGHHDSRKYPDFKLLGRNYANCVDCLIISHFHLDHCGSLPYFTEVLGYNGPIYMSAPTKAICRILLNDCRKFFNDKKGKYNYTEDMVEKCLSRVQILNLNQVIHVDKDITIKSFYAGHVLGAIMTLIKVDNVKVVYTGDFNMTSDRHLGQAQIERVNPDVLITESTYGMYTRPPRATREQSFLSKVHTCVLQGGKVLIPTFAVGKAQELAVMLDTYWDQHGLKAPIFFSGEIMEKANEYYKLFLNWTNMNLDAPNYKNPFSFTHVSKFNVSYVDSSDSCVVFATPGMLTAGFSSRLFERWATDPKNLLILPGYCVNGTTGWYLLNGERNVRHRGQQINVKMQVENLSYSAHSDARGIMELVQQCGALNVVLVHGSKTNMDGLKKRIVKELKIPCYAPATGVTVSIKCDKKLNISLGQSYLDLVSSEHSELIKSIMLKDQSLKLTLPNKNGLFTKGIIVKSTTNHQTHYSICSEDDFIAQYSELLEMSKCDLFHLYWIKINPGTIMESFLDQEYTLVAFYTHLFMELANRLNLQEIKCTNQPDCILFADYKLCLLRPELTMHTQYKIGMSFSLETEISLIKSLANIIMRSCL